MLTPAKEKILEFVLENPDAEIKVRELAKKLDLSPAHVSKTLKKFRAEGIVEGDSINFNTPLVKALKIFLNVKKLVERGVIAKIGSLDVISAGIYGSWANGTNHKDSDLDIWVKVEKHPGEMKIASLTGELRKLGGVDVQMLVLTPDKLQRLREENPTFYHSLVFGSIVVCGETLE